MSVVYLRIWVTFQTKTIFTSAKLEAYPLKSFSEIWQDRFYDLFRYQKHIESSLWNENVNLKHFGSVKLVCLFQCVSQPQRLFTLKCPTLFVDLERLTKTKTKTESGKTSGKGKKNKKLEEKGT